MVFLESELVRLIVATLPPNDHDFPQYQDVKNPIKRDNIYVRANNTRCIYNKRR